MPVRERYQKRAILGQGGMGLVYRAYDSEMQREVALKTIRDPSEPGALDLFRKECDVLALLNHPNLIDIYDIGELEEGGRRTPYFVMPLLKGATLDRLIREAPERLTVERVVDIISQVCRGLQAAHERGLVHRDIKPSNLFILDDDSVKIIDFGVARLAERTTLGGVKGTLLYLSPEQVEHRTATPLSDIYSLGVVSFEAVTHRHPHAGIPESELAHAILRRVPPPASEINPAVSTPLSQVIHAAMAKRPYQRFPTAREFSEALQKALRNQTLERFDPARIEPRISRVERALGEGEYEYAGEILAEVEAEGHLHPAMQELRRRIDRALHDRTVSRLLENARLRIGEEEYGLAFEKIQEVLHLDPANPDALILKSEAEARRTKQQIDSWLELARRHLEQHAFIPARQALENILAIRPGDSDASRLLAEVDRREQEHVRAHARKESLHQEALEHWKAGDLSEALSRLEAVLDLERSTPGSSSPDRSATYQDLYNRVRSESDALRAAHEQARKNLARGEVHAAAGICDEWLAKYPDHALFRALRFDLDDARRQRLSAEIARVDSEVAAEADLDRRVTLLEEAVARNPGEGHFEKALKAAAMKRDMVNGIVAKARACEQRGEFDEASSQWEILRNAYPGYPGIDIELERLKNRRDEQAHADAKAQRAARIDQMLESGDYSAALALTTDALSEYPGDSELSALENLARQGLQRVETARGLLAQGTELLRQNRSAEGLEMLRRACDLDPRSPAIAKALAEALLAEASQELDRDCIAAERLLNEACYLDPSNARARGLKLLLVDSKRELVVGRHLTRARGFQVAGALRKALGAIEEGLYAYPEEPRLAHLKSTLLRMLEERRPGASAEPADEAGGLEHSVETPVDCAVLESLFEQAETLMRETARRQGAAAVPQPGTRTFQPPSAPIAAVSTPSEPSVPDSSAEPTRTIAARTPEPAVAEAGVPVPEAVRAKPRQFPVPALRWVAICLVLVVAAIGLAWWFTHRGKPPSPEPVAVRITFSVSPETAHVRVSGKDFGAARELSLLPGRHELEFFRDGFKPQTRTVSVTSGGIALPPVILEPLPASLTLAIASAKALLDRQPALLQQGRYASELAPGEHTLELTHTGGRATLRIRVVPGEIPEVVLTPSGMSVVAVSVLGNRARVYGPGPDSTADLVNLAPGLQPVKAGESELSVQVDGGPKPAIFVFAAGPDMSRLTIQANEDGAAVILDGVESGFIKGGLWTGNLRPGHYRVRVEKPGYVSRGEEKVELAKGASLTRQFTLTRSLAMLRVTDAPGAVVLVDGQERGQIPDSGILDLQVEPGRRTVGLRKPGFESPGPVERDFRAGEQITFSGTEVLRALGRVRLSVSPENASIAYLRPGERTPQLAKPGTLALPAGEYVFTARADRYVDDTRRVTVSPGAESAVAFHLRPVPANVERKATPALYGMKSLSGAWQEKDGWLAYEDRSRLSLLDAAPAGTVTFSVQRKGSFVRRVFGSKTAWVAFYVDSANHLLFELEETKLAAYQILGGRRAERGHLLVPRGESEVRVELLPDRVIARVGRVGRLEVQAPPALRRGKFGFKAPITLRNFAFETRAQ